MAAGSDTPGVGTRAHQEETSPFPLELMLAAARAAQSQDETAPFPLDFEIVARKKRQNQDETAPFPLELMVIHPDGELELVRSVPVVSSRAAASEATLPAASRPADSRPVVPRPVGSQPVASRLPSLKWRGFEASAELREYAARVAAGEELPPFRGPLLAAPVDAHAGQPRSAPEPTLADERPGDSKAFVKLALAVMVMAAALVAAAVLGDDAELRAAGQSIGSWLEGPERSTAPFPLVAPAASANAPCEAAAP